MRFAYADPPYPGMAHLYKDHPDYGGEVDHKALIERLVSEYPDGWALSTNERDLRDLLILCSSSVRVCLWIKPDAQPQRNDGRELSYSWEPVLVSGGRRPSEYVRNYAIIPKTPGQVDRGLIGSKPVHFCFWIFRCLGASRGDTLDDLFPGSGAVGRAWERFQRQIPLEGGDAPPEPSQLTLEAA